MRLAESDLFDDVIVNIKYEDLSRAEDYEQLRRVITYGEAPWREKLAEQCGKTLALREVATKLIAAFDKPSNYAPLSDAIENVRSALGAEATP